MRKPTAMDVELTILKGEERRFFKKRTGQKDSKLNQFLVEKVPDTLQNTLSTAFAKAFGLIFEKGTGLIEKTYRKEELEQTYQAAMEEEQNWKTLRGFSKRAGKAGNTNLLVSGAAGIGMGTLGVGIPDIPVFTAMMLRSLYEIAIHYGYDYASEAERRFILLLIQGGVSYGEKLQSIDKELNEYIVLGCWQNEAEMEGLIRDTARCLSGELLYMKFLQGTPIVGAVGGAYDAIYMKRINEYAELKYRRRFYTEHKSKS